jgi:toxin-antitoxin system PIN domain toxin
VLVDANILIYAVDESSTFHGAAREWLESALNGDRRVGLPWQSLVAFTRIATHPRAMSDPLGPDEAWSLVEEWVEAPAAWIPTPTRAHGATIGRLLRSLDLRANLVTDTVLAALCIEHGLTIVSADSDFARFTEIAWLNPVAPR